MAGIQKEIEDETTAYTVKKKYHYYRSDQKVSICIPSLIFSTPLQTLSKLSKIKLTALKYEYAGSEESSKRMIDFVYENHFKASLLS